MTNKKLYLVFHHKMISGKGTRATAQSREFALNAAEFALNAGFNPQHSMWFPKTTKSDS